MTLNTIIQGDTIETLKTFPDESIDCIVTSPPYYGLRDYGIDGQIGLEPSLEQYLENMLAVTAELKRVLKKTGTMWWNHGDSYSSKSVGSGGEGKMGDNVYARLKKRAGFEVKQTAYGIPDKCLSLQAHRLAIRMVDEQGWILRNQIIWHKPNCMPSSVKDRFTVDFEPIFFFTKSKKYWFEMQYEPHQHPERGIGEHNSTNPHATRGNKEAIAWSPKVVQYNPLGRKKRTVWTTPNSKKWESTQGGGGTSFKGHSGYFKADGSPIGYAEGRNKRCVWKITTKPYPEAHFATFPPAIVETPIKAGCPVGGVVLDPFMGSGTVAFVARQLGRNYVGIELNPEYIKLANRRLQQEVLFAA